jgi:hypothetical protein
MLQANITVVMSVCRSVRMDQLVSNRTDFHEIWYLNIFRNYFNCYGVTTQLTLYFYNLVTISP